MEGVLGRVKGVPGVPGVPGVLVGVVNARDGDPEREADVLFPDRPRR